MSISIFHADPPDFFNQQPPGTKYLHVAEVASDDLEVAWERTNTVDRPWWTNLGVTPKFTGQGCRSTSVGDLAVRNGVTYRVAMCGWRRVFKLTPKPQSEGEWVPVAGWHLGVRVAFWAPKGGPYTYSEERVIVWPYGPNEKPDDDDLEQDGFVVLLKEV